MSEEAKAYKCASPNCPGYPYQASQIPHPFSTCGVRAVADRASARSMDRPASLDPEWEPKSLAERMDDDLREAVNNARRDLEDWLYHPDAGGGLLREKARAALPIVQLAVDTIMKERDAALDESKRQHEITMKEKVRADENARRVREVENMIATIARAAKEAISVQGLFDEDEDEDSDPASVDEVIDVIERLSDRINALIRERANESRLRDLSVDAESRDRRDQAVRLVALLGIDTGDRTLDGIEQLVVDRVRDLVCGPMANVAPSTHAAELARTVEIETLRGELERIRAMFPEPHQAHRSAEARVRRAVDHIAELHEGMVMLKKFFDDLSDKVWGLDREAVNYKTDDIPF